MNQPDPTAVALLKQAESYLSALHGSVARHDHLAANLGCAGCELRDQINAALPTLAVSTQVHPPVSRADVLREAAGHLARQADELWAPGTKAHTVMHADAAELRRMADEARQPSPAVCPPLPCRTPGAGCLHGCQLAADELGRDGQAMEAETRQDGAQP